MTNRIDREFLTREEAAKYLSSLGCDVTPGTLALWASTGRYDLPFHKIGRWCRYKKSDLDAWLETRRIGELAEVPTNDNL